MKYYYFHFSLYQCFQGFSTPEHHPGDDINTWALCGTCVFVALECKEWIRSVQGKDTNDVIVSARGDEASWVAVVGSDDAHAGHEIVMTPHAVHFCKPPVWTEQTRKQRNEDDNTKLTLN